MYNLCFSINCSDHQKDSLLALLSQLPFDGFEEKSGGIDAWLNDSTQQNGVREQLATLQEIIPFKWEETQIEQQNWNAVWESNFTPVQVGQFCGLRAEFHPKFDDVKHDILIRPKQAFGTGHHATTYMMMQQMENLNFPNTKVLDYGCGTGVLAILAKMLGAKEVIGVDIEEPSYENTIENTTLNDIHDIDTRWGTLDDIPEGDFDIILANINRNVILESLPTLYTKLKKNAQLLLSGILLKDEPLVKKAVIDEGFSIGNSISRGDWVSMLVIK